jgi:hypothetical protein
MAPTFQAAGTAVASTGTSVSAAWPTHLADDIGLVVIETSGNSATLTPPTGWAAIPGTPVTDVATTAGSKLHVWWKRAASSAEGSVATGAATDHIVARLYTFRGCITTGNPWNVTTTGTKTTASTTATVPALVTTLDDTLITMIVGRPDDSSSTTHFGVPVNANLTGLADRGEAGTANNNGGGFVLSTGIDATPGNTGTSTLTKTVSTTDTYVVLALKATTELIGTTSTYTLAGTTTGLLFNRRLDKQVGTFSIAGISANLNKSFELIGTTQSYTLTGTNSLLQAGFKLDTTVASFTVTGIDTVIAKSAFLDVSSGVFVLSGNSIDQSYQRALIGTTGAYSVVGNNLSFQKQVSLFPLTGTFNIGLNSTALNYNSIFYLTPATFTTRLQSNGDFFWYRTTQTIQPTKYRLTNRNQWILGRATHMGRRGI